MTPSPNLAEQSLSESTTGSRPAPIANGRRPAASGGNRRLHVAFDGRHLTAAVPRGMDRYTLGLIRGLTARGIEVTLFARAKEPLNRALLTGSGARLRELPDRSAV